MADNDHLKHWVKNRSEEAFSELVAKYGGMVTGAALRRTGDRQAAEDICQNVFVVLARKAPLLLEYRTLSAWLHRTTLLETRNFLRQQRRRKRKLEAFESMESQRSAPQQTHPAIECIDEAIDKLSSTDRKVLTLKFFEGMTNREIAAETGKTEAASQKQVHRASQRLADLMRKKGVPVSIAFLTGQLLPNLCETLSASSVSSISTAAAAQSQSVGAASITSNLAQIMTTKPSNWIAVIATLAIVAAIPLTLRSSPQPDHPQAAKPTTPPPTPTPQNAEATAGQARPEQSPSSIRQEPANEQKTSVTMLDHNVSVRIWGNYRDGVPVDFSFTGCGAEMAATALLGDVNVSGRAIPVVGEFTLTAAKAAEGYKTTLVIESMTPNKTDSGIRYATRSEKGEATLMPGKEAVIFEKGEHALKVKLENLERKVSKPIPGAEIELSGTLPGSKAFRLNSAAIAKGDNVLGKVNFKGEEIPIQSTAECSVKLVDSGYLVDYIFGVTMPQIETEGLAYSDVVVRGQALCPHGQAIQVYSGTLDLQIKMVDPKP